MPLGASTLPPLPCRLSTRARWTWFRASPGRCFS